MITAAEMFLDASIGGYRNLFLTTKPNFGIGLPLKSEFPAMYLVKLVSLENPLFLTPYLSMPPK